MDELIEQLTSQLGIDSSTANAGVSKTMAMLKDHAGDDLFGKISGAIPGAAEAAQADGGSAGAVAGGGMLGKLAGMASSALGGNAGGGLEMASALASTGIDAEKLGPFITTVIGFLKEKLGDDVVDQLLSKLPMLKTLLG
ncbi:Protein of unknown function VcgC/VcgE [Neorhodopirellula lusitana]|uniref:DUF2780 domain-containing protein n=1 Tax=Neorhodopirellula lusitana TaxID=445327 RepID=A0ABY1PUP8_9BACT|nr:DUF2780 domain-containing protein [Neorhodopirellula lusitana]SMP46033.1 Protein of unknown function VcgC/VcgE [Neorhodopirellula lusitana]